MHYTSQTLSVLQCLNCLNNALRFSKALEFAQNASELAGSQQTEGTVRRNERCNIVRGLCTEVDELFISVESDFLNAFCSYCLGLCLKAQDSLTKSYSAFQKSYKQILKLTESTVLNGRIVGQIAAIQAKMKVCIFNFPDKTVFNRPVTFRQLHIKQSTQKPLEHLLLFSRQCMNLWLDTL